MPDREKVIKELEETEIMLTQAVDRGGEMAVMGAFKCLNCVANAIALLKEQEAHILTLDEAVDGNHVYYVEFQYHLDRGWVKCDFDRMYVDGEVAMLFLRDKTFYQQKEHYGQLWRLWSNQPTYEQMKTVKWE